MIVEVCGPVPSCEMSKCRAIIILLPNSNNAWLLNYLRLALSKHRELPSRQQLRFYLPVISRSWSPEEICAFVNMARDNEAFVYQYTGKRRVRSDNMIELLQQQEITKSISKITSIMKALQNSPDIDFICLQISQSKRRWGWICCFKTFVEAKGLITPPKDHNDLFCHFPAIEDSINTARQLRKVLSQSGFENRSEGVSSAVEHVSTKTNW